MSPCKNTVGGDLSVTLLWPGIGCPAPFLASTALSGSEVEVKGQCRSAPSEETLGLEAFVCFWVELCLDIA